MSLVLWPVRCIVCREALVLVDDAHVCSSCVPLILFNNAARCSACDGAHGERCIDCPASTASFDGLRAPLCHNDTAAHLLEQGRRLSRTDVWTQLGRCIAADSSARELAAQADVLVPVPADLQRLKTRGINPSTRLAQHLAQAWGTTIDFALTPTRATLRQTHLPRVQRLTNMTAAFMSRHEVPPVVALVDDCVVTGATARAAARALRAAGAERIVVIAAVRA